MIAFRWAGPTAEEEVGRGYLRAAGVNLKAAVTLTKNSFTKVVIDLLGSSAGAYLPANLRAYQPIHIAASY